MEARGNNVDYAHNFMALLITTFYIHSHEHTDNYSCCFGFIAHFLFGSV